MGLHIFTQQSFLPSGFCNCPCARCAGNKKDESLLGCRFVAINGRPAPSAGRTDVIRLSVPIRCHSLSYLLTRSFTARWISRSLSRFAITWRLSYNLLPRTKPISTFARFFFKYIRSGTMVNPFS